MGNKTRILVTGAGGFIGHHLVKRLKADGHWVRGVDIKQPEYEKSAADDFQILDLRMWENCLTATRDIDQVYNLAADMGGIGYITAFLADISKNNILINAHMLEASKQNDVKRYLFSSSACVYAQYKQKVADLAPLKEEDAYPADPEPGYGWEKLFAEELCRYYYHDYKFETRIVRFHNVYGPLGTYDGGKEKSPAAISRKVAHADDKSKNPDIELQPEQIQALIDGDRVLPADGLSLLASLDRTLAGPDGASAPPASLRSCADARKKYQARHPDDRVHAD